MKIAFIGDMAFIGRYEIHSRRCKERLLRFKKELKKYDYVVGNLEMPFTDRTFTLKCKAWHLRASKENAAVLKWLGVNAVNLANNHIYDFGRSGADDTIEVLRKNGISWFGIDGISHDCMIQGEKIRFSGFCCYSTYGHNYLKRHGTRGVNLLNYDNMRRQKMKDEQDGFFSCMTVHWGREFSHYPGKYHVILAEKLMHSGNIAMIGSHPHYIQGIDVPAGRNALCAYSLGNGIYDEVDSLNKNLKVPFMEENKKALLLGIHIRNRRIQKIQVQGWYHSDEELMPKDLQDEVEKYSLVFQTKISWPDYLKKRDAEFAEYNKALNLRRDINWFLSRCNYFLIGAKIRSLVIHLLYQKEEKRIIGRE